MCRGQWCTKKGVLHYTPNKKKIEKGIVFIFFLEIVFFVDPLEVVTNYLLLSRI